MIDLKDLQCLVILVQQGHFARAAKKCALSQPAFSMRIRNLEERLDTRIVKRGNRYQGLTTEGEIVVEQAKAILNQVRGLEESVRAAKGEVVGDLVLCVIPSVAPYAGLIASRLRTQFPNIRLRVETATSFTVQQGVDDGRYDAGLTYVEGTPADLHFVEELYDEEYALLVDARLTQAEDEITWSAAAELPLVLLNKDMQNRRILDSIFKDIDAQPTVFAETGDFSAAIAMAMNGAGATVLPLIYADTLDLKPDIRILPLVDPVIRKPVALVTPQRTQNIPAVQALRSVSLEQ